MKKVKNLARIIYLARHHSVHQLLGLTYLVWIFSLWQIPLTAQYLLLGIICNELIDLDHFMYVFWYGRNSSYGKKFNNTLRKSGFIKAAQFMSEHHKRLTGVISHNVYVCATLALAATYCFSSRQIPQTILLGASAIHLGFDMIDDLWFLGHLNMNWFFPRRGIRLAKKLAF